MPNASKRGTKSTMTHKWTNWLHNPCCLGVVQRFKAGDKISRVPQMGKLATQPVPIGGVPYSSKRGTKSTVAHKWADWQHNRCQLGGPLRFKEGTKSAVAHKWANWQHNPCRLGSALRYREGAHKISNGPQVGRLATEPMPSGVPNASERGGGGVIVAQCTVCLLGGLEGGRKSAMANMWAD